MEESTYLNEWIAKGEARGEARGEMREAQSSILQLGTIKFGNAPERIVGMIRAIADHARLQRIISRVFDAVSWDDLIATP